MICIDKANITVGTRTLVRCDLDVPLENGKILETFRLDMALETLTYIIKNGGIPVIMGHIGKPEGNPDGNLSTKHLLPYFNEKLGENTFELLENLRFDPREEQNDDAFAQELAKNATIYVNESFATSHRKHTSIVAITKYLPSYAGFELTREIETLENLTKNPQKPFVALVAGAKLESKKPVISKLLQVADYVLVGGKIGMEWKEELPDNLLIPSDYATENKDIGEQTINKYVEIINTAKTILWAGPMGMYEDANYINGTRKVAEAITNQTKTNSVLSVIGGGDTIAAINKLNMLNQFSFVSTGGGAMLDFIAEGTLPGIEALNNK